MENQNEKTFVEETAKVRNQDLRVNVTDKQMFNAALGTPLKEAADTESEIIMTGFAVTETVDLTTGELKTVNVIVTQDGTLYSGTSQVMENRLRQFHSIYNEEELKKGIRVKFVPIKCGRGKGTSLMVL